jgi:ABC-type Mn2+/Zn2+ transport system permease subunit
MTVKNKRLTGILLTSSLLLFVPLIAMQFTDEVNWKVLDFVIAGALLLSSGLIIEFVIRRVKQSRSRIIMIITIVALLLLIWAELAVGIFGTPFSGS